MSWRWEGSARGDTPATERQARKPPRPLATRPAGGHNRAMGASAVFSRRALGAGALVIAVGALGWVLGQKTLNVAEASEPSSGVERLSLFHIERNKNKNVVRYDVLLDSSGHPLQDRPIDAYWRMDAEDGRRRELNAFERSRAYGFSVRERPGKDELVITLNAFPQRPVRVRVRVETRRAEALVEIGGQGAFLDRIFVQAKEGTLPKVEWIDLYGRRAGGTPVHERVTR